MCLFLLVVLEVVAVSLENEYEMVVVEDERVGSSVASCAVLMGLPVLPLERLLNLTYFDSLQNETICGQGPLEMTS